MNNNATSDDLWSPFRSELERIANDYIPVNDSQAPLALAEMREALQSLLANTKLSGGEAVRSDDLLDLWVQAFDAFQSANGATRIGDIPGGGFDRIARMWEDFEKIVGHLKANALALPPQRSGGRQAHIVGGSDI